MNALHEERPVDYFMESIHIQRYTVDLNITKLRINTTMQKEGL
jgi:hypothetical protein